MRRQFFAGKKVLVMGLGRFGGGLDVAKFALGAGANVTITDLASAQSLRNSLEQLKQNSNIKLHLGCHEKQDFKQADIIVVNPAVPPDNSFLKIARDEKKIVTSQIEIFFQLCPAIKIGITGSNGKSTTTALTAHILKNQIGQKNFKYNNVWLGGNIGNKPLLETVDQITSDDLVVLELSSFQLEQLAQIEMAPDISVLTNLTPNHLDRHGSFENYCLAKENIFKFQKPNNALSPVSIFNTDDEISCQWYKRYCHENNRKCLKFYPEQLDDSLKNKFPLPGQANLSNLAAAVTVANVLGVKDNQIANCLPSFKSLPHRLELVKDKNGIKWYNDSISTTPQSTIVALQAFCQPKILIAGGYDKNLPFDELGTEIAKNAKAAILIGKTAEKIATTIPQNAKTQILFADSLQKAVEQADSIAENGDVVLLSPACASYDMFENFQQRGEIFCKLVEQLTR